jgi:hypothetical protein
MTAETNSRDQVGLELIQINIQGPIETKRSSNRRDDLGNKSVQIGEAGRRDTQVLLADVINCLVIDLAPCGQSLCILRIKKVRTMNEQSECSRVV